MNAPYGEHDPFGLERLVPSQHVLINAIDECAIEIEKKGRFAVAAWLTNTFREYFESPLAGIGFSLWLLSKLPTVAWERFVV